MSRLLWTLGLGVFAGALDLSVLSPALPAIGKLFGVQTGDLAWIFTLYLLVTVLSITLATTLADRYGRRPIYLLCILLFAIGSVLAIAAPDYTIFLIARGIQALGAGGIFPVATATIADVVPAERRGAALGAVAATWGLAAIVGPTLGGLITHYVSWHYIFAANLPLAAVVFWLAREVVPANAPRRRGRARCRRTRAALLRPAAVDGRPDSKPDRGRTSSASDCSRGLHVGTNRARRTRTGRTVAQAATFKNVQFGNRHRNARGLALLHTCRARRRAGNVVCGGRVGRPRWAR